MFTVNCSVCGGQPLFDDSESGREAVCRLCLESLVVTPAKAPGELSAEEQMAHYEEALKESDWGHQPC